MIAVALIALAAAVPQALAHGGVLSYTFEGKDYPGFKPYNSPSGQSTIQRPWATYDPIQDATASTVACNDDGTSIAGQLTATISAGSPIRANWNSPWPHPYGPQMTYLAKCPGSTCTGVDAKTLKWFKIDESGLISGTVANGYWGAGKMIDQNNTWTSTIPKSVPSGSYMIRFETVALHSLPAQLYPECAQIDIINGGSLAPTSAELVSFPGGYSNSDPGFQVDLYGQAAKTQTTYQIPGPKLYAGATATGGGSGGSSPSSSTTGATTTTRSTTTSTTTTRTTTTSSAPTSGSGGAAQYAQCGGKGWTGATTCASPYKCTAQNEYYSQCM